jgi:hypothetical protein
MPAEEGIDLPVLFDFFRCPGGTLKRTVFCLVLSIAAAPASLLAQNTQTASNDSQPPASVDSRYAITSASPHTWVQPNYTSAPFSRVAFGGGVSTMGINMQVAVVANRYINLRGVGNFFNYSINNVAVSGLNASGKVNLATAAASVDFYPFPNHGFRISPGAMFYNQNQVTASVTAPGGTSFTLDDYTYYSSKANPVTGGGAVGFNTQNPAFTITTGWGNMIPRRGGHLAFPFEIGAAFIGSPAVNMALTSGQVCQDPAGTIGCMNVVGNSQISSNLAAQVAKYQKDLNPFRFYPILSTGISYSFNLRGGHSSPVARPQ